MEKPVAEPSSDDRKGGTTEAKFEGFKVPSLTLARPKTQPEDIKPPEEEKDTTLCPDVDRPSASKDSAYSLPYNEPTWSSAPPELYSLTVIKHGTVIEQMKLSHKPFHVFGRLPSCDVQLEHPSISRYHAVLQYRPQDSTENESKDTESGSTHSDYIQSSSVSVYPKEEGFYVYDLGSTHGTYVNKRKIQMRCFYRLRLGQMVKFGGSSRLFLLEVSLSSLG